jgi:hypothetical protein
MGYLTALTSVREEHVQISVTPGRWLEAMLCHGTERRPPAPLAEQRNTTQEFDLNTSITSSIPIPVIVFRCHVCTTILHPDWFCY